ECDRPLHVCRKPEIGRKYHPVVWVRAAEVNQSSGVGYVVGVQVAVAVQRTNRDIKGHTCHGVSRNCNHEVVRCQGSHQDVAFASDTGLDIGGGDVLGAGRVQRRPERESVRSVIVGGKGIGPWQAGGVWIAAGEGYRAGVVGDRVPVLVHGGDGHVEVHASL